MVLTLLRFQKFKVKFLSSIIFLRVNLNCFWLNDLHDCLSKLYFDYTKIDHVTYLKLLDMLLYTKGAVSFMKSRTIHVTCEMNLCQVKLKIVMVWTVEIIVLSNGHGSLV